MKLTFVVPCYNEEKNIKLFYEDVLKNFKDSKYEIELIFINDGSKDGTLDELKKLTNKKDFKIMVINFSRNFGKEAGIYAGLEYSTGDFIVLIDADMQQPPSLVLNMLQAIEKDSDIDIVAYYQEKRIEGKILTFFKSKFYKLMNKITDVPFVNGASDFRLFKKSVKDTILKMSEHDRFSKGIFAYIGFNTHYIPYTPSKRANGKTSWSFKKLFIYALSGILSFSKTPIRIISKLGILNIFISIIWMLVLLILNLFDSIWFICSFILFVSGINFFLEGILGEYIYRSYKENRARPIYIAKEVITNEKDS